MKRTPWKSCCVALLLALILTLTGACVASGETQKVFVTSFYPMYVFTLNVTQGVAGVTVRNMADQTVGCLHDYQLQTRDMAAIEQADALIINGGGMEQFLDKVAQLRPTLPIIDTSAGMDLLASGESTQAHAAHTHAHDHEARNAHVWLDPMLAAQQVQRIADGLAQADPANADAYTRNAQAYIARLEVLHAELAAQLAPLAGTPIVTFHEAFAYFAGAYGLEVAGVIAVEPGQEPSTREVAKLCDVVRALGVRALFVEPQYPQKAAQTIARETGASVFTLDTIVSGDGTAQSYEQLMRQNAAVLVEALGQ